MRRKPTLGAPSGMLFNDPVVRFARSGLEPDEFAQDILEYGFLGDACAQLADGHPEFCEQPHAQHPDERFTQPVPLQRAGSFCPGWETPVLVAASKPAKSGTAASSYPPMSPAEEIISSISWRSGLSLRPWRTRIAQPVTSSPSCAASSTAVTASTRARCFLRRFSLVFATARASASAAWKMDALRYRL
jgi:hypothetical protein